ncbi:MAG TPA: YoaK family protein [Xanthobacteraceae bacterium]|nr:YoaK family protein [Xanthobacteraceae bacterium]
MPAPRNMPRFVPPLLSFVAGYIDVVTFVALFGLYVAQVTGSFVTAGAQIVGHNHANAFITILAIPVFVLAAIVTVLFCHVLARRGHSPLGWSLALEAVLLAAFYGCALIGPLNRTGGATLVASLLALAAMGVQSALVKLLMRDVASTNVMTTNTSLLGIDAAEFLLAWNEKRKFPKNRRAAEVFRKRRKSFYRLGEITLGFLAGAALGAVIYHEVGLHALIAPIAIVVLFAALAFARKLGSRHF